MSYTQHLPFTLNEKETCLFSFEKNHREEVRISDVTYNGRPYIDFRIFTKNRFGEAHPTTKGITVSRELLPALQKALNSIT